MKSKAIVIGLLAMLICACGSGVVIQPVGERNIGGQEVQVEEIQFRSGKFRLVGDLRMPLGNGPHPAVIMVHGDGPTTRDGYPTTYQPVLELFLRNGYAVFSWDKPGSGESTGALNHVITERADILADGIEVLAEHPSIDKTRIGLWGISQAGWVMPMALERTDKADFMIVVSGGGENGIEQMAYQVGQVVACRGGAAEEAALADQSWSRAFGATSYDEYRTAAETLLEIPGVQADTGLRITEESKWKALGTRTQNPNAFFDPMDILEQTTIPVLAFFGELDKNIDPVQGAAAYEAALQQAGNQDYQVETIPDVAHTLVPAKTGCLNETWGSKLAPEYLEALETWLQRLAR
jgi:hypothetical protein